MIVVPPRPASATSAARSAQFVSPSTLSFVVQTATEPAGGPYVFTPTGTLSFNESAMSCVAGTGASAGSSTCTTSLPNIPAGDYEGLIVNAYDGLNGTGTILSTNEYDQGPGPTYATVCGETLGASNVCTATLSGIPVSYVVTQATPFTSGVAGSSALTVQAYDADGNLIVSPPAAARNFAGPNNGVAGLQITPSSTHITLPHAGPGCSSSGPNAVEVFGPSCAITLTYDGAATFESAPLNLSLDDGYASLSPTASSVYDFNNLPAFFYPNKTPAACSGAATLTIPVPAAATPNAPGTLTNGAPSC